MTWVELFWILLLGIPILLPGRLIALDWHPFLLAALVAIESMQWVRVQLAKSKDKLDINTSAPLHKKFVTWHAVHPLEVTTYLLIICVGVSLWVSVDRTTSYIAAGYLLVGIAFFNMFVKWSLVNHDPFYSMLFLLVTGGGLAIVSPPFIAWKPQFRLFHFPLYERIQSLHIDIGETIHANVLAGTIVLVLPIFAVLALRCNWTYFRWLRLLCIGMTLVMLFILILTQSRAAYLAASVALFLILLLCWPRVLYIAPLGILGTIMAVGFIGIQPLLEQFSSDSSLGGWAGRLDVWHNSLQAIVDFSFTGIGMGTFTLVMPMLYPLQVSIEGYPHAHNLFLQIGVDLGLPGLIVYLGMLLNLFVMLIVTLRSPYAIALHRTLAIGATGSLVGMLIHGLLDAVTWGTKLAFVPWVLFALITQLFLYTKATQANPRSLS